MHVVAVDGVPVNSQDGTQPGGLIGVKHFTLPVASRVEVVVPAPPPTVHLAQLLTLNINTGPDGDNDPQRPLATIHLVSDANASGANDEGVGAFTALNTGQQRFGGLGSAPVAVRRTVFFAEIQPTTFFMAVGVKPEHVFDPNADPDIVATQGTVEEWTVQNRAKENHEFHFHQLHFLVESQRASRSASTSAAPTSETSYSTATSSATRTWA
jgi:FtsP/CotA-like multicopper oxidase with cupredoxin domain